MTGAMVLEKLTALSSGPLASCLATTKRVAVPLWKLLTFSLADEAILPKRALAVSIEPTGVQIAYGSRFLSRIRVSGMRTYPFEEGKYPSPANLASTVALAQSELRAFRSELTLSIPKAWALVRVVTLPSAVKENLGSVISYELDRLTPFSADAALYDYQLLTETDGKLNLTLVAARADLVDPYLQALREKGIVVTRVTVALSGLATLSNFIHGALRGPARFVSLTAKGYEGGLITDGTLGAHFSGHVDHQDPPSTVEALLEELTPYDAPLLATGDVSTLTELKRRLPSVIDLEEAFARRVHPPGSAPVAFGSVLESLWPQAKGFNLLRKGRQSKATIPVVLTLILACALATIGILYVVTPLKLEEQRLTAIDTRVAALRTEVKKVEALKKEVDALQAEVATIENLKKGKPMALALLKELTTLLPKNAWLTRMRITDTTVEMDGYAAAATELLPKLEASPLLKKVEFASPTFRDMRLNADRFVIKMEIEGVLPHGK